MRNFAEEASLVGCVLGKGHLPICDVYRDVMGGHRTGVRRVVGIDVRWEIIRIDLANGNLRDSVLCRGHDCRRSSRQIGRDIDDGRRSSDSSGSGRSLTGRNRACSGSTGDTTVRAARARHGERWRVREEEGRGGTICSRKEMICVM